MFLNVQLFINKNSAPKISFIILQSQKGEISGKIGINFQKFSRVIFQTQTTLQRSKCCNFLTFPPAVYSSLPNQSSALLGFSPHDDDTL